MGLVLKDGDYVRSGDGAFRTAVGDEEVLQRVLWLLSVRRGSFPFLSEMGSRLFLLPREKPGNRLSAAKQYVEEALSGEPGLKVTDVALNEGEGGAIGLTVYMEYRGEALSGVVTVAG